MPTGLTVPQMIWDVFLVLVSLGLAVAFAFLWGEALLQRWADKRRTREWKVLGDSVEDNIRYSIGAVYVQAQLQGQLDRTAGFNYRKWQTHLQEINSRVLLRGGDGILTDADLRNPEADSQAILGATAVGLNHAGALATKLSQAQMWYWHALPTGKRIQLSMALMAAQHASQAVKRLGIPDPQATKRDYDIQATTNLRAMIAFFKEVSALLELLPPPKDAHPDRFGR